MRYTRLFLRNTQIPPHGWGGTYDEISGSLRKLEKECDLLYKRRRSNRTDPYSANHPNNRGLWTNPPSHSFCTRVLSNPKRADNASTQKAFGNYHSKILRLFFREGRLRSALPKSLRGPLVSYREFPLALDSKFLPSGAVRRILY